MMDGAVRTLRTVGRTEGAPDMLYQYLTPLRPFLRDDSVHEVVVNRPGEVWTESTSGWRRHPVPALSYDALMQIARLVANFNHTAIGPEHPILSAGLIYGERIHIVIPPACEADTVSLTVRKPAVQHRSLDELERTGGFKDCTDANDGLSEVERRLLHLQQAGEIRHFLDLAVRARRNLLIVGKTGSGKTTVARSLIGSIPTDERLVTIEDVHELFLHTHPNRVHLFYAREGAAFPVTARDALVSCLRMRPDRILLSELRGEEAWEFVKLINTGHPGSISTMHANGAREAFGQLTALIKDSQAGAHLDTAYIHRRLITTIDVVLFYDQRRLREIYYDPERKHQQMAA